ncbi:MAG: hypothetical protein VW405_06955 [Rhodospirillaceae bacterium]
MDRPTDGPAAYYQAQGLRQRVRELVSAKDQIGQAETAVETALAGTDAIESLTSHLKGLALPVKGGSAAERQAAAEQFDVIRNQITALANDVSFNGVALVAETPGRLDVNLDGKGGPDLTVDGHAAGAAGLGIGSAATDYNNFATDADIDAAVAKLNTAVTTVRNFAADFGTDLATLTIRDRFNQDLTNTIGEGTAKLVEADLNVEAVRALAA